MFKAMKRWWKYLGAKLNRSFNEAADPRVQLDQAIDEAQQQQRMLKEQAASVIANQKQTEIRLNRALEELEKINRNARQAILMAEEAKTASDEAKVLEYTQAAEAFANRLVALEQEVEDLKSLHLQSAQAADQAKSAVSQNAMVLQKRLSERQALLSQLDQAEMQERMNEAMAQLTEAVGDDVPSFEEVRDKIEARYAKAKGMSELQGTTVESKMLEVERAAMSTEAQARLSEIKSQLGIDTAPAEVEAATPAVGTGSADQGGQAERSPAADGENA